MYPIFAGGMTAAFNIVSWIYDSASLLINDRPYSPSLNKNLIFGVLGLIVYVVCKVFNYRYQLKLLTGSWKMEDVDSFIQKRLVELAPALDSRPPFDIRNNIKNTKNRVEQLALIFDFEVKFFGRVRTVVMDTQVIEQNINIR
jgi:hypothetical protein